VEQVLSTGMGDARTRFTISDFPVLVLSAGKSDICLIDTYVEDVNEVSMRSPGRADAAEI
jgi:hypothetical protein